MWIPMESVPVCTTEDFEFVIYFQFITALLKALEDFGKLIALLAPAVITITYFIEIWFRVCKCAENLEYLLYERSELVH